MKQEVLITDSEDNGRESGSLDICTACGGTPCVWEVMGNESIAEVENKSQEDKYIVINDKTLRFKAYKKYTKKRYWYFGRSVRV